MTELPIGIQTFRKLREAGYCYANKTPLIERLARERQMYFLARPRRFGKSKLRILGEPWPTTAARPGSNPRTTPAAEKSSRP
ncbi:MAG: AAA family ATPase [Candidatus Competibacteraceae bacterium]